MTNAELIQTIKAEIERQQRENVNYDENGGFASYCDFSAWSVLDSMLTFVSGLEKSEKQNQEELEKEIEEYFPESSFYTGFNYNDMQEIAHHFAKWGKEQGYREGFLEGAKIQREEDNQYVDTIYQQGIEKGKDEIMEKAVEGVVILRDMYDNRAKDIDFTIPDNLKIGDKVRIIILPKEE